MEDNLLQGEEQIIGNEPEGEVQDVGDNVNLENQQIPEAGSDQSQAPANLNETVDLLLQQNKFLSQQIEALKAGNFQQPQQQQPQPEKDPVAEILESLGDEDYVDKNTLGTALSKVFEAVNEKSQKVRQETESELRERKVRDSEERMRQEIPEFSQMFQKYLAREYFGNQDFRNYVDNSPDPARKAWEIIQGTPEYRQEVLQKKAQQRKQTQEPERRSVTTTGMSGAAPEGRKDYANMSLAEIRAESDKVIRGR
jgi:hypothetical protein